MRQWWFLIVLIFLYSCNYFASKEERTQTIVNKELMAIDWGDVDQYPLFETCDEMASKSEQRNCFSREMRNQLAKAFEDIVYEVDEELKETLYIDFEVDEYGLISMIAIEKNATIENILPKFEEQIRSHIRHLKVIPAHKRGINVTIKFRLPIVLDTNR